MDWTQTIAIIGTILVATTLVATMIKGLDKRIDDVHKRINDVMSQLSELRQAIWGMLSPRGADDDDDDE